MGRRRHDDNDLEAVLVDADLDAVEKPCSLCAFEVQALDPAGGGEGFDPRVDRAMCRFYGSLC